MLGSGSDRHPVWRDTFPSGHSASGQRNCTKSSSTRLGSAAVVLLVCLASDQEERGVKHAVGRSTDGVYLPTASFTLFIRDSTSLFSVRRSRKEVQILEIKTPGSKG